MLQLLVLSGHGQNDVGAIAYDGQNERDINRKQLQTFISNMTNYGNVQVIFEEVNTSVEGEVALAKKYPNIDFIISLHNNSASGLNGDGWEGLHYPGDKKGIGILKAIEEEVLKVGQNSRGLKPRNDLRIIKETTPTSIICEGRFLNNPNDLVSDELMSIAYVKGIARYYNLQLKENKCPTCGK